MSNSPDIETAADGGASWRKWLPASSFIEGWSSGGSLLDRVSGNGSPTLRIGALLSTIVGSVSAAFAFNVVAVLQRQAQAAAAFVSGLFRSLLELINVWRGLGSVANSSVADTSTALSQGGIAAFAFGVVIAVGLVIIGIATLWVIRRVV